MTSQINEKELKRYLYGEMTESEIEQIEDKIFADDNFFYDILNLENELVDLYVRRKLEPEEISRFENSLKNQPERQAKVANAIALQTIIEESKPIEKKAEENKLTFWDSLKNFFTLHTLAVSSAMTALLLMFLLVPIVVLVILNLQSKSSYQARNTYNGNSNIFPMSGNSNNNAGNTSPGNYGNGAKPTESATATPVPIKTIILQPDTNSEIIIEDNSKQINVKLILPESVNQQTFTVKLDNLGDPFYASSQTEDNKKVINLKLTLNNLVSAKHKITVQNSQANVNLEYNFTIRKK